MRRPFYSIRSGILANLIFLILAAMLLINAIMIKLAERDLIRARLRQGLALAKALCVVIESGFRSSEQDLRANPEKSLRLKVKELLEKGDFSEFIFLPTKGYPHWALGDWGHGRAEAIALCRQAMVTDKESFAFYGSTWGVIWIGYENLKIAVPVKSGARVIGALSICSHLGDLYRHLRDSEKIILIYILLNTIVLLAAGMYLLSRLVIRPIQRLLRVTEQFKEGEPLPVTVEPATNEIGQLFHSLKMMLKRLEENKKELKEHIATLEEKNEELRRTQEEVIRSEKLASVGRLAAGIAHEVGNPVGVVLGYLDLMKNEELSGQEIKDALERCESEIGRINKIIRQLLDYSRPTPPVSQQVRVHALLSETIEMLQPQPIMRKISIHKSFGSPKDTVLGEESRLKQVFVNIILNAADAIDERRKINGPQGETKIEIKTQNTQGTIKISFQDCGCGIPNESLDRIFDPFYSTKDPGRGTGLGLGVSYRIIEQMGGKIRAESREGEGTTIHVILPLFEETK